ncbi:MAG: hypothetical protein Q7T82_01910 [Armatimonadota bacterium]|nr:hypothetical protein [Armatimonadota bacterium]
MSKQAKTIPELKSVDEESEFWDKHSAVEFLDEDSVVEIDASRAREKRDKASMLSRFLRSACIAASLAVLCLCSSPPGGAVTVRKLTVPRTAAENDRQRGVDICVGRDGRLMVVWAEGEIEAQRVYFSQSNDGGKSFAAPVPVNPTADALLHGRERTAVVRADAKGNAYVLWARTATANVSFLVSRSTDKGKSFSPPVSAHPSTPVTARDLGDMDVSAEGVVLVAWLQTRVRADGGGQAPVDIYAARSQDGGVTFQAPVRVDETVCECCSPAVSAIGRDTFFVAWRDLADNIRDIRYAVSTDSGRSFAPSQWVARDGWRLDMCPMSGPVLASSPDGVLASWMEAAQGSPNVHLSLLKQDKSPKALDIPGKGRNQPAIAAGPSGQVAVASRSDRGIDVVLPAGVGRASAESISVSTTGSYPKIAFLNERAIAVAWQDDASGRIGLAVVELDRK